MIGGVIPVLYSFYGKSGRSILRRTRSRSRGSWPGKRAASRCWGWHPREHRLRRTSARRVLRLTAQHLPAAATLLVTTRPDDDLRDIARIALESRDEVGLIVQIRRDPGANVVARKSTSLRSGCRRAARS